MDKIFWIILVFVAGALLPIQAGLNGKMGEALQSPLWAVLISFLVGLLAMLLYVLVQQDNLKVQNISQVPAQTWVAGVLGAVYVSTVVLAFPKLGPALTFGLIVGGQLSISILLEHFNILVHASVSVDLGKNLSLMVDYDIFWRYSLHDGIYGPNVALIFEGESANRFIGRQLGLNLEYSPTAFLSIVPEFAWFEAGQYLKDVSPGKDVLFAALIVQCKF